MDRKNWTVKTYTDDEWTLLVDRKSDLACIIIANTTGGSIDASVRLATADGTELGVLLPTTAVAANDTKTFQIPGFMVEARNIIQVKASATGLHFIAAGKVD